MSLSIGATTSNGIYALPFRPAGQSRSAASTESTNQAAKVQAKVTAAQLALANANSVVDGDKRNHSPGCVACDQKLVDKAQAQLSQARASADEQPMQAPTSLGSTIDIKV